MKRSENVRPNVWGFRRALSMPSCGRSVSWAVRQMFTSGSVQFLPDPGDEFLLELAVAGPADAIVTHNVRHFAGSELLACGDDTSRVFEDNRGIRPRAKASQYRKICTKGLPNSPPGTASRWRSSWRPRRRIPPRTGSSRPCGRHRHAQRTALCRFGVVGMRVMTPREFLRTIEG